MVAEVARGEGMRTSALLFWFGIFFMVNRFLLFDDDYWFLLATVFGIFLVVNRFLL